MLAGNQGVGKSFIKKQFVGPTSSGLLSTIGLDYSKKEINVDDSTVSFKVWDKAGSGRLSQVSHSYYKGCDGIVLCYDITDRDSFVSLQSWIEKIQSPEKKIPVVVAGNKLDQCNLRAVSTAEGMAFASKYGCQFMEVSAAIGVSIDILFKTLARDCIKFKEASSPNTSISEHLDRNSENKRNAMNTSSNSDSDHHGWRFNSLEEEEVFS